MTSTRSSIAGSLIFSLAWFVSQNVNEAAADGVWKKVEKILAEDQGLMVLDGIEKVPARYEGNERPVYGDWLILRAFSEPATLNPYK
ncbi:MAG: hypothetical protein OXH06_04610 [Gemmatimonadetes bacterium]|nr:hypothetical protein [Gemmatimonadota bacterium]